MNILFFVTTKLIHGGGEKVRNWLAGHLADAGHTVYYATFFPKEEFDADLKKVGLYGKIKVVEYPFHLKKKHPVKYIGIIKNLYQDTKIDILIHFGGTLLEQIAARKAGTKVLLSERCDPASRPFASRVLKQIQYRVSDGYVFQTEPASCCYGKRAKAKSVVIPNPIIDKLPAPIFDGLRKEVVSVGRLSPEKNQKMLVNAFFKFHEVHPDYRLVIYGSGPLEMELKEAIHVNGLDNCAEIIKGKTNITELINGAELFVLPSNTEGMPNALIEAMSVGIMSISADCPIYGPRMLIENGVNGYLTPVGDEDALYKNMCKAIENKTAATAIRHEAVSIRQRLNEEKIFKCWMDYIHKLAKCE
jgi:glycosyltransferase involved in cell wall biosynthesis